MVSVLAKYAPSDAKGFVYVFLITLRVTTELRLAILACG